MEENVKLERTWHEHVHGKTYTKLSQRQIVALAGEFYREMVAVHRDNPGTPADWEAAMRLDAKRKKRPTTRQPRDTPPVGPNNNRKAGWKPWCDFMPICVCGSQACLRGWQPSVPRSRRR
jgi:hypothetical protein